MTVLAAVGYGWLVDRHAAKQRERQAVARLRALHICVYYNYELNEEGHPIYPRPEPPGLLGLQCILGDDWFADVVRVDFFAHRTVGDEFSLVRAFPHLKRLYLYDTRVTDSDLIHVRELQQLESLHLCVMQTSNAGVVHLKQLSSLKYLLIQDTSITEAGAAELNKALPNCDIVFRYMH